MWYVWKYLWMGRIKRTHFSQRHHIFYTFPDCGQTLLFSKWKCDCLCFHTVIKVKCQNKIARWRLGVLPFFPAVWRRYYAFDGVLIVRNLKIIILLSFFVVIKSVLSKVKTFWETKRITRGVKDYDRFKPYQFKAGF